MKKVIYTVVLALLVLAWNELRKPPYQKYYEMRGPR